MGNRFVSIDASGPSKQMFSCAESAAKTRRRNLSSAASITDVPIVAFI